MKKSKSLKKLSLKKLTISKLTNSDVIQGGSGICDPNQSRPFNDCPEVMTCLRTKCMSCTPTSQQVNGC